MAETVSPAMSTNPCWQGGKDDRPTCNKEYHENYIESYQHEEKHSFCSGKSYLDGQRCAFCDRKFVSHVPGDDEFRPNTTARVHYCSKCFAWWKRKTKGIKKKDRVLLPMHCLCEDCYRPKLAKCGATPVSPRKDRGGKNNLKVNYAGMQ